MKRTVCIILVLAMLFSVSAAAAEVDADVPFEVYNLTFDDGSTGGLNFGASAQYADGGVSGKALYVTANGGKPFEVELKNLNPSSLSEICTYIKTEGEALAKMTVRLTSGSKKSEYVIDTKTLKPSSWTKLSGRCQTSFMTLSSSIELIISVSSDGGEKDFMLDNFKVMSDTVSKSAEAKPVEDIKSRYTGNLLERASFEKPTLEMFSLYGTGYEITDEAGAHSGNYALKVKNRTASWHAVRCMYNDMDKKAKYTVSLWVKKSPKLDKCTFSIQGEIVLLSGNKTYPFLSSVTVTDDKWHRLEGVVDGTKYEVGTSIGFQISIGDSNLSDYYVDDVIVSADKPGRLYDDLDYREGVVPEGISHTPTSQSPIEKPIQTDIPSLKDVYKDYFKIGACTTATKQLVDDVDTPAEQLIIKHFNSIVHDGAMKMQEILPKKDRINYDFTKGDYLMEFAQKNGIDDITGHCLIWEIASIAPYAQDSNGQWLSRDDALAFMKEYITKVMKHYEGDGSPSEYKAGINYSDWHIDVWDVVNEALLPGNELYANRNAFINCVGNDYIEYAFRYADETGYDDVKLRYNDYGEQSPSKRQAMYDLIKKLQNKGVRVDSLGMQSHYRINVLPSQIRDALELFSSLGVSIDVTEADISAYTDSQVAKKQSLYENGITTAAEIAQANLYYNNFEIYKEYADIIDRVVFWSYEDLGSYQNRSDGFTRTDYAGLFDRHFQAKPLYWAIADPEYYFSQILNEDTSKVRISLDGVELDVKQEDLYEKDGVTYLRGSYLLDVLGKECIFADNRYSFIANGLYFSLGADSQIVDFAEHKMNSAPVMADGDIFLPVIETCTLMGYTAEYNSIRNIVGISSNQSSNNL